MLGVEMGTLQHEKAHNLSLPKARPGLSALGLLPADRASCLPNSSCRCSPPAHHVILVGLGMVAKGSCSPCLQSRNAAGQLGAMGTL